MLPHEFADGYGSPGSHPPKIGGLRLWLPRLLHDLRGVQGDPLEFDAWGGGGAARCPRMKIKFMSVADTNAIGPEVET